VNAMKCQTRFRCVVCGKLTAGRMPREGREVGDTTARFPRRHHHNGRPCPGNIQLAAWVDVENGRVVYEGTA
jgi:hypothetical protein